LEAQTEKETEIMSEKTLKVHPAASAFPKITGKDLKEVSSPFTFLRIDSGQTRRAGLQMIP
jgi:hypothetical protein